MALSRLRVARRVHWPSRSALRLPPQVPAAVDTYFLKWRYYFQEYSPATAAKPASHTHLHHWVFLIDADVNDYEEAPGSGIGSISAHLTASVQRPPCASLDSWRSCGASLRARTQTHHAHAYHATRTRLSRTAHTPITHRAHACCLLGCRPNGGRGSAEALEFLLSARHDPALPRAILHPRGVVERRHGPDHLQRERHVRQARLRPFFGSVQRGRLRRHSTVQYGGRGSIPCCQSSHIRLARDGYLTVTWRLHELAQSVGPPLAPTDLTRSVPPPLVLSNGPNRARRSLRQPAWASVAVQRHTGHQHHRDQVLQQHLPPLGPGTPRRSLPTHDCCAPLPITLALGVVINRSWLGVVPPLPCDRWRNGLTYHLTCVASVAVRQMAQWTGLLTYDTDPY